MQTAFFLIYLDLLENVLNPVILRDKTMADKLIYIPIELTKLTLSRLQLLV